MTVSDGVGNSTSASNIELLIGGDGSNTLDYTSYGSSITVDLEAGTAEGDFEVLGIENVVGTSGSDEITGNDRANRIEGGSGDDALAGGLELMPDGKLAVCLSRRGRGWPSCWVPMSLRPVPTRWCLPAGAPSQTTWRSMAWPVNRPAGS